MGASTTRVLSTEDLASLRPLAQCVWSHQGRKAEKLDADLTWVSDGGDELKGKKGDYHITVDGRQWTVAASKFDGYYTCGPDGMWYKTAPSYALRMDEPFSLETLEGPAGGQAGDYLFFGEDEAWPVTAATWVSAEYTSEPPPSR